MNTCARQTRPAWALRGDTCLSVPCLPLTFLFPQHILLVTPWELENDFIFNYGCTHFHLADFGRDSSRWPLFSIYLCSSHVTDLLMTA